MDRLTPHPHHPLMHLYADDAARTMQPWLMWEMRSAVTGFTWVPLKHHPTWEMNSEYRRKVDE